ncbi:Signal transduction histidine kinase [Amycolatopsis pretoriensis]|uniref:histidine kinase n=1 Tax=Amycolatopsis pretoriensis TaxID=218821 RepID=A0A1H5QXQ9_9PSEU|nr:histidine kinase [Amycolatopsis pretoriensis]SEF30865.1 Signal transduction histidine kinase [Amycolatopsis pretoriensis]
MPNRPLLPDTIAPTWLVVQVLGTLFVAGTLLTAREPNPWIWAAYGVSSACWLGFVALASRRPKTAAALLAVAGALPAALVGRAADSSAILMAVIPLGRLAALTTVGVGAIVGVGLLEMALAVTAHLVAGQSLGAALADAAVMLLLVLVGLNRRQYEVQAGQAEALLDQTRLAQAEHARAAALDERTRIAREIHDVLAHSLGALRVQLELAEALLTERSDVDGALRSVRRSRRLAADGLAEARNAVAALRRDVPPLAEALAAVTAEHAGDHGADVGFEADGEPRPLPSAAVVALVSVAREALTNAGKHAPGEDVRMRLEYASEEVRLEVRNPRSEFTRTGEGFGLAGMRERLALAGGTLESGPDDGYWRVLARIRG